MTRDELIVLVPRDDVSAAIRGLRAVPGVNVQIAQLDKERGETFANRADGFRDLSLTAYIPLMISVASLATSALGLAKVVLEIRKLSASSSKDRAADVPPILIDNRRTVENRIIVIDRDATSQQIAAFIAGQLAEREPHSERTPTSVPRDALPKAGPPQGGER